MKKKRLDSCLYAAGLRLVFRALAYTGLHFQPQLGHMYVRSIVGKPWASYCPRDALGAMAPAVDSPVAAFEEMLHCVMDPRAGLLPVTVHVNFAVGSKPFVDQLQWQDGLWIAICIHGVQRRPSKARLFRRLAPYILHGPLAS